MDVYVYVDEIELKWIIDREWNLKQPDYRYLYYFSLGLSAHFGSRKACPIEIDHGNSAKIE